MIKQIFIQFNFFAFWYKLINKNRKKYYNEEDGERILLNVNAKRSEVFFERR